MRASGHTLSAPSGGRCYSGRARGVRIAGDDEADGDGFIHAQALGVADVPGGSSGGER